MATGETLTVFSPTNAEQLKKKRTSRKRNRCDMSPEELRRLRERERKAQQNRRDRLRAQKKQAQLDVTWESLIETRSNDNIRSGSVPSMIDFRDEESENTSPNGTLQQSEDGEIQNGNGYIATDMPEKRHMRDEPHEKSDRQYENVEDVDDKILKERELKRIHSHEQYFTGHNREHRYQNGSSLSSETTAFKKYEHRHRLSPERKFSSAALLSPTHLIAPKNFPEMISPELHRLHSYDHSRLSPHEHSHLTPPVFPSHYLKEGRYLADMQYPYHHSNDKYLSEGYLYGRHHIEKRAINRNVDRKKLKEDELEELRRKERNYQRERRARLRLEKSKTHGEDRDALIYYHSAPIFHSNHVKSPNSDLVRSDREFHEEDYEIRKDSPPVKEENIKTEKNNDEKLQELEVAIPGENKPKEYHSDSELLQVVPKDRDYEELKNEKQSPEFHLRLSPPNQKSFREKRGSPNNYIQNWNHDTQNERTISHEKPRTKVEENKPTSRDRELTEDQLERRRRSNREAQRRRRARMKMLEERPSSSLDNYKDHVSMFDYTNEDVKRCRVKVTPSRPSSLEDMPRNCISRRDKYYEHCLHDKTKGVSSYHQHSLDHHHRSYYHHHHHQHHDRHREHYDHYERDRHERHRIHPYIHENMHESNSKGLSELSTRLEEPETIIVNPKFDQGSRKRKQLAPRKVMASKESNSEQGSVCVTDEEQRVFFPETDEITGKIVETCDDVQQLPDIDDEILEESENLVIVEQAEDLE